MIAFLWENPNPDSILVSKNRLCVSLLKSENIDYEPEESTLPVDPLDQI